MFQEIKSQSFRLANMETQLEGLKKSSKETAQENNKMRSGKDFFFFAPSNLAMVSIIFVFLLLVL